MEPTARSLARTYKDRTYDDPWDRVQDYHRVQEYADENPFEGAYVVGNAVDLPQHRVDGWLKDAKPNAVNGIETARERGWLNLDPENQMTAALVRVAAHVAVGGNIYDTYIPTVATGDAFEATELVEVFRDVNVDATIRLQDNGHPSDVVVARDNGSVLGRCLLCMGIPRGAETHLNELADLLDEVSTSVREDAESIVEQHLGRSLDLV